VVSKTLATVGASDALGYCESRFLVNRAKA